MEDFRRQEEHVRLFQLLLKGELGRVDVAKLERAILTIANECVEKLSKQKHWWLDRLGISPDDLAVESVAELLARKDAVAYAEFRQSLERMRSPQTEASSFCRYVHGIIGNLVMEAFSRLLAKQDSLYPRLLHALRRHERNTPELRLVKTCAGLVYHRTSTDMLTGRQYMPVDELAVRIAWPASNKGRKRARGAPTNIVLLVLNSCLDLLEEQDEYCRAVTEHDVLWLTKEILACGFEAENHESFEFDPFDSTRCESSSRIAAALEATSEWMEERYVQKGKLTAGEAEAMQKAIKEFCCPSTKGKRKGATACLHLEAENGRSRKKQLRIFDKILKHFLDEI
jgi:hypothetical protein